MANVLDVVGFFRPGEGAADLWEVRQRVTRDKASEIEVMGVHDRSSEAVRMVRAAAVSMLTSRGGWYVFR